MSSEHLACPECRNGDFWLLPDGGIMCADEDCRARFRVGPFGASWRHAGTPVSLVSLIHDGRDAAGHLREAAARADPARVDAMLAHVDAQAAALPDRDRSPQPVPAGDDIAALVAFTRARLDEHGASVRNLLARAQETSLVLQEPGLLGRFIPGWHSWPDVEALCQHALREVAAMRAIVDGFEVAARSPYDLPAGVHDGRGDSERLRDEAMLDVMGSVVRALATIWDGHPDFRPGWAQ